MSVAKGLIFVGLLAVTTPAVAQSQQIAVDSCVGQLTMLESATGAPSGLFFSVVNQTTHAGATVTVSNNLNPATINSAGNGSFAVTVPESWRDAVLAMFAHSGYQTVALLDYHMNGTNYVLEDFRLVQGYGQSPPPSCP